MLLFQIPTSKTISLLSFGNGHYYMLVSECVVGMIKVSFTLSAAFVVINFHLVVKYFLLGNPAVYWGSTASLGIFGLIVLWYLIRWQRGFNDLKATEVDQIHYAGIYPVIGWFLHYLPFVAMGRVTYVHHYYPALYFAILTMGFCLDFGTRKLSKQVNWAIFGSLYVLIIGLFWLFRALCFGMVGPSSQWSHLKWFNSWRITD
jgi:dolichyl-phosphate-mannose-protein mannosyltransferase